MVGPVEWFAERIGPATYSIYFFHLYFLSTFAALASSMGSATILLLVIVPGIPSAVIVPIYVQDLFDRVTRPLLGRRPAKGPDSSS